MSTQILLVEDDPDSQDLVRALCAAHGYAVDVAGDGFLGLRMLSEGRHPIVLIDYHLPEMDGYALARLMREIVGGRGPVRLIGITADRHGLASRRGADALFDAILVKPIEPALLHATLDRLSAPEAAPPPPPAGSDGGRQAADGLWHRRGLPARPRAVLCPEPDPETVAAVRQAFDLVPAETAEIVLVSSEAGLPALQAIRAGGPDRFLPAADLTGHLGAACDLAFRVNDPACWDALAATVRAFAERRGALDPDLRGAEDPADRLLAALFVGDRPLALDRSGPADPATATAAGLPQAALMTATLTLTEQGLAACEASSGGVAVRLTEAGRMAAIRGRRAAGPTPPARNGRWQAPTIATASAAPHADAAEAVQEPILDPTRIAILREMIGDVEVDRLHGRLLARLETIFPPGAAPDEIVQEAHALVAMAGSLGFARLSAACRVLETALRTGSDASADLGAARHAIRETLETVRRSA